MQKHEQALPTHHASTATGSLPLQSAQRPQRSRHNTDSCSNLDTLLINVAQTVRECDDLYHWSQTDADVCISAPDQVEGSTPASLVYSFQ